MDSLNYHMRGLIEDGVYESIKPSFLPTLFDRCGLIAEEELSEESDEFTVKDLSGFLYIFCGACILSLIVEFCDSTSRHNLNIFLEKELGEAHCEG